jgi:membrane associated rhomboid family serine protease
MPTYFCPVSITVVIIALCAVFSIAGFQNTDLISKYAYTPFRVAEHREWYRIFTHAFLHADWMHLFVNMFVLYSFGSAVETGFAYLFKGTANFYFILLFLGGVAFAAIPAMRRYRNAPFYRAVGASGAVSAVLFSSIILMPMNKIYIIFIPIGIPAFIFGPLYLALEVYLDKRGGDNVAHHAHYWGAIFGAAFTLILEPALFLSFVNQIFR